MGILNHIRKTKEASASQDDATMHDGLTSKADQKTAKKRKVSISTIIMTLVLVIGLAVMAYPTFSDWWNSFHQAKVIQEYVEAVQGTDPKLIEKMIKDAQAYNKTLENNNGRFSLTKDESDEYNSLLNLTGNGVMGYVNIPSIGVNLPVYHGVDEVHLQVAVGHIEGSSLPVGGPSTHCVVSAHRGLPSAKLFTDLDQLKEGDIFTFTVLDRTLTYEVDQIRTVKPNELSDLEIKKDADYCTLITCTPYGVNSHRMLVRGHRIENLSDRSEVPAEAVQIPAYIAIPAVGIPLIFIYLLGALIYYRHRHRELDTKAALEAIREQAMNADSGNEDGEGSKESKSASKKE